MHIRWMNIANDLPAVVRLDKQAFEHPWSADDWRGCLQGRDCIAMVAEIGDYGYGEIVGSMCYALCANRYELLTIAVAKDKRRRGIGRAMIEKMTDKLDARGRPRLTLAVRESNLDAHLFFRSCGLAATTILREHYEDTDEAAYVFSYRIMELVT